jgi:hypothetical protein
MRLREFIALLGAIVALWPPVVRAHQANMVVPVKFSCDSLPVEPARTDRYIGLSRINRQQSEIAAGRCTAKERYREISSADRPSPQDEAAVAKWK